MFARWILTAALLASLPAPAAAQKADTWVEVRSPNFVVVSSAGEKQARRIAQQFELFRLVSQRTLPQLQFDLRKPLLILAVKDEKGLKELLPEFWEKGRKRVGGIFIPGTERLYIALRTDPDWEHPYATVYHEYTHALLRRNFENIPVWLNEGLAEFLAHCELGAKEATVGRPSAQHVLRLRAERPLPLEVLLTVDHDSPHYNEDKQASVFYAQAWALTHFLFMDDRAIKNGYYRKYVTRLAQGVAEKAAAEQTFGELRAFERTLESYVRQPVLMVASVKATLEVDEKTFSFRILSPGQSLALRGDFHAHMNRPTEARALLETALRLDPASAQAHESMGLLYLRERDFASAGQWFEKAAQLDSTSYLTHYYAAMMEVQRGSLGQMGGMKEASGRLEASLKRATELNPSFAPAYSLLATVYQFHEDKLEDALKAAREAARLEPGEVHLHLNVANILMRMKRVDEAIRLGQTVLAASKDAQQRGAATRFLQEALEYKESLARYEAVRKAQEERAARQAEEWRKLEAEAEAARNTPPMENYIDATGQQGLARGIITIVSCAQPAALHVTLQLRQNALKFRAANRAQVAYYSDHARVPRKFDPCTQLRNALAEITYKPASGRAYAGDILAIEMLPAASASAPAGDGAAAPAAPQPMAANPARTSAASSPAKPEFAAARAEAPARRAITGWAEGRIVAVTCKDAELLITIDLTGGYIVRLHATNYFQLDFLQGPGWKEMPNFQPCQHLLRRVVEAGYTGVAGQPYDGELVTIKLLR